MFSKVIVTGPTEYPNGEWCSTGAPDASWYVVVALLPPVSPIYFPPTVVTSPVGPSTAVLSAAGVLLEDRRQAIAGNCQEL